MFKVYLLLIHSGQRSYVCWMCLYSMYKFQRFFFFYAVLRSLNIMKEFTLKLTRGESCILPSMGTVFQLPWELSFNTWEVLKKKKSNSQIRVSLTLLWSVFNGQNSWNKLPESVIHFGHLTSEVHADGWWRDSCPVHRTFHGSHPDPETRQRLLQSC